MPRNATPAPTSDKPLRKDAARNRERILEAARDLFQQRGLSASLNDIARHAGVGVGTVYRHFPDKDQLVEGLFEQRIEELVTRMEQAVADPDPWHGLTSFIRESTEMQADDRGIKDLLTGGHVGPRADLQGPEPADADGRGVDSPSACLRPAASGHRDDRSDADPGDHGPVDRRVRRGSSPSSTGGTWRSCSGGSPPGPDERAAAAGRAAGLRPSRADHVQRQESTLSSDTDAGRAAQPTSSAR